MRAKSLAMSLAIYSLYLAFFSSLHENLFMNNSFTSKRRASWLDYSFKPINPRAAPIERMTGSIPRAAAAHQAHAPSKIKLSAIKTNMPDILILINN